MGFGSGAVTAISALLMFLLTCFSSCPPIAEAAWAVTVAQFLSLRQAIIHDISQLSRILKLSPAVACPLAGGQVISWHSDRDQRGYLGQLGRMFLLTQNHRERCVGAFTGVVAAYGFFFLHCFAEIISLLHHYSITFVFLDMGWPLCKVKVRYTWTCASTQIQSLNIM